MRFFSFKEKGMIDNPRITLSTDYRNLDIKSPLVAEQERQGERMEGRFTEEELAIAKSVDLCAVAESLGYTVKKIGKYHTLKEMDSIRIYDRSHWYRWSRQFDKGNNGGSQIDFLRVFGGMSVKEAVFWLLDFAGYRRIESTAKQPLVHQVTKKQPQERKPLCFHSQQGIIPT